MVAVVEPQAQDFVNETAEPAADRAALRKRQVLMIGESLPLGSDRRTWLQAASLRDSGFSVSVLAPQAESRVGGYPGLSGIRLLPYRQMMAPTDEMAARRAARTETFLLGRTILQEAMQSPGFSVLSLAQPPAVSLPLARLGQLLGKTIVLDYRVPAPEIVLEQGGVEDSVVYRAARRLEEKLLICADLVLCPNEAVLGTLAGRTNGLRDKLVLVRSGIDPNIAALGAGTRSFAKTRRHLVAYAGPLTVYSGADLFVRTARRIVYGLDRADIQFVLAGSGPQAEAIHNLVIAEGLKDFVTCVPGDDPAAVTDLLLSADLAVDPTPKSQLGELISSIALLDYGTLGIPAVAFRRTEVEEAGLRSVLTVHGGGVPELTQGILEALERPLQREPSASKARLWSVDGGPAYIAALQGALKLDLPVVQVAMAEAN